MISKDEFLEWKKREVTKKFLELLVMGQQLALEDLVAARGEIGDVARGAHLAYTEVIETVNTGYGILEEK